MKYESKIGNIEDDAGRKIKLYLLSSPFHPEGGGQPGDSGLISGESFKGKIVDTIKTSLGKAHITRILDGKPSVGDDVVVELDEERHKRLTMMHSAQHIISRILENKHPDISTKKVNIGDLESAIYMKYDSELSWDMLFDAEDETNRIIAEGRSVSSSLVTAEDAALIKGLKIKWERIPPGEKVQVVSIDGLDATACCGTHVENTAELPEILITGFKGSRPDWEIKYSLFREPVLDKYGKIVRTFSRDIGCPPEKLEKMYLKLQKENRRYRKILEKLRSYIDIPWEKSGHSGRMLYYAVLPGLDKGLVLPAAKRVVTDDPAAVALILMPDDACPDSFPFLLLQGESGKRDIVAALKSGELKARGGGDGHLLSGVTGCQSLAVWTEAILNN